MYFCPNENRNKARNGNNYNSLENVINLAILGYSLGLLSPIWLAISLTFAAGAMLYVVFGELIPEAVLMYRRKLPAVELLLGFLAGIVLGYR